ncbi:MAG: O-methyltransferase [Proteobacteria bacterium]|nr:O-methyltransferase [Pseudomonadota bacterium]
MADPDSRSGRRYADRELLRYVERVHCTSESELDRAFEAPELHAIPAIQLGKSEAAMVGLLIRLLRGPRVVEIGTLAGYSALHIARALPDEGRLWTLESDPRHARIARENLQEAGMGAKVDVVLGPALETLPGLAARAGPFDAVLIDADKEAYPDYGRWASANLRSGGLLIADNVYYFGELLADTPGAAAMRRFHEEAARNFDTVCVPTPDGMLLGLKR